MPRSFETFDEKSHGRLAFTHISPDLVDVFYIPPPRKAVKPPAEVWNYKARLLQIDTQKNLLSIFPMYTTKSALHDLFEPKYNNIKAIIVDLYYPGLELPLPITQQEVMDILEELPSSFIKDYDYGLGITKMYIPILKAIQKLSDRTESDCTKIAILYNQKTGIIKNDKTFYINREDYENLSKDLGDINRRASTASLAVREVASRNFFADKIGLPQIPVGAGRHPLRKLFTAIAQGNEDHLSAEEQEAILRIMSRNVKPMAREKLKILLDLQDDVVVANLEVFNSRFEHLLNGKAQNESFWQGFFTDNPFILSLAVGCPVIIVQGQAFVGGSSFSGEGNRIADFLVKSSKTKNVAIVEIKNPQTKLLGGKYRKGVIGPSRDLSGAIIQMLDQKSNLEKSFPILKDNTSDMDVELHSVQCCLIIGNMPTDSKEQRSFELIRQNSKSVNIVTFDELLEILKQLQYFLTEYKKDYNGKDVQ